MLSEEEKKDINLFVSRFCEDIALKNKIELMIKIELYNSLKEYDLIEFAKFKQVVKYPTLLKEVNEKVKKSLIEYLSKKECNFF